MLDEKKRNPFILLGLDEITHYVGRSKKFVQNAITGQKFPAKKIEGKWQSDKRKINKWLLSFFE